MSQVRDLILKCWAKSPNDRKTEGEVLEEIKIIYVNHELEPHCQEMGSELQCNEKESLLIKNETILELNGNEGKNNGTCNFECRNTYL